MPLTALALALVVGLLAVVNARPTRPVSLAAWAGSELGPTAVLHADALDRAELLAGRRPAPSGCATWTCRRGRASW